MSLKITAFISFLLFFYTINTFAQVTSANLSGVLTDEKGKPLTGAIVEALHVPSGSKYGTDTKNDGSFNIQNMRVGGPYKVTFSFGGGVIRTFDSIDLQLGQTYQLFVKLGGEEHQLTGVTVTSSRDNVFNNQHTGATTIITSDQINTLPSISRSVFDFTALSPQSNGQNFEGRDAHYNNMQINGANFNNSFGLSTGFSGSNSGMPIPLDAVQQVQVSISDFDLKQNNYTGANINLVTKSGTNSLVGDAYTYYRNQNFNGTHVGDFTLPAASKSINNVYGASLGGPIIKNKLFFYASAEYEQNAHPALSPAWQANGAGVSNGTVSNVSADSMQEVSNYVKSKYGYNTGAYPGGQGYNNTFTTTYLRLLGRIDYNINDKNKLDFSYNAYRDAIPSNPSSSGPNGGVANARIGLNSLAFDNSGYNSVNKVNAFSAELLSKISDNVDNQVLVTFNSTRDTRSSPSSVFPFIDINNNTLANNNYMSLGYELFTYKNDVQQSAAGFYDNLTVRAGINNFTAGVDYQSLSFANSYLPYGTSYYRYASIQDFINNAAPIGFALTYPYQGQDGYSRVHYGLPGAYVQDRVNLFNNRLTLTGGVRADLPLYLNTIPSNKYIDTLNLLDPHTAYNNGFGTAYKTTHYDASKWPVEQVVLAPRIGFNWSPLENRKLQIRGGSGIFMGQVPFVWFTNAPANSGTVTNNVQISDPNVLQYMTFQPTTAQAMAQLGKLAPAVLAANFPQQSGNSVPGFIAAVDPQFHMPRVWRSDLSADYKLPWYRLIATAELMYTKDIYSVYQFNANQPNPTGVLADSNDHRPIYPALQTGRIYPNISGAYILANSKPGDVYSATIGITLPAKKGFYGSFHYTRMFSEEVSANPGSQASSAWEDLDHLNSPNENILAPSAYYVPNRYVGTVSYRFEYLKHFASTITLFYSGANGGRFDWTYYDDINGDNIFGQLIYIPKSAAELNWAPIEIRGAFSNTVIYSVAQEEAAFDAFMNQDPYMKSHKGQYMQRNGESLPFYNTLNLKFIQDFINNIGPHHNSLQFSLDISNLPNLINKDWGIQKTVVVSYGSILVGSTNTKGVTTYTMATVSKTDNNGNTITYNKPDPGSATLGIAPDGAIGPLNSPEQFLPTSSFVNSNTTGSVWGMQIGLRYNFW